MTAQYPELLQSFGVFKNSMHIYSDLQELATFSARSIAVVTWISDF